MDPSEAAPSPDVPSRADQALLLLLADPAQAVTVAEQALAHAQAEADAAEEALAHLALALARLRSGDTARGRDGLAHALPCLDRADAADPRSARARHQVRRVQAELLRHEGRHEEALELLSALRSEGSGRAEIDEFLLLMALGIVQGLCDRMEDALGSFYAGLDLAQRMGVPSLEVNALNNLGSHQLDLYNLEDALPLLRRCLSGAIEIGSRRQRIFAAGNLLQCLCAMGQPAEALALAREHLIPVIRPDDPPSLQRDEEIAEALLDNGLIADARIVLARDAQEDVLTNPVTALRAWLHARALLAEGRPDEARRLCVAQGAAADDEAVMPIYRLRLHEITAEAAARCGDHAAAYAALAKAHALKDAVLGRAARARTISLQIEHDLRSARRERDVAVDLARRLERMNRELQGQVRANEELQRRLRSQALEDALTGLHNRRHLFEVAPARIELALRAARVGGPDAELAVALIDLDHFKAVNDRHGHDAGDQVLRRFAERLREAMRRSDLCCRYGGEEFVVVWCGLGAGKALRRLEALQRDVALLRFDGADGQAFGCSFSAGVAELGPAGDTLPTLLASADAALYRAKLEGRGRVCLAEPTAAAATAAAEEREGLHGAASAVADDPAAPDSGLGASAPLRG